jgi:hypothetical protein
MLVAGLPTAAAVQPARWETVSIHLALLQWLRGWGSVNLWAQACVCSAQKQTPLRRVNKCTGATMVPRHL